MFIIDSSPTKQRKIMAGEHAMHDDQNHISILDGEKCEILDREFQSVAFLAKSLSDENRLRILLCISQGKKAVGSIVEELGLSQPLVSHHLKELKRSLLVKIERSGPFIYYELSDPAILGAIRDLNTVAKNLLAARTTF
jgi:ArsR family transcriptional regulator, zinc-responsive transcriptional repressor